MQQELERLFERLTFGPEVDARDPEKVEAWLRETGVESPHRDYLREHFAELAVYRRLVRGTLREALELAIPRTAARLGALFDEYFDAFLDAEAPRTHYLRDVTSEFLDFCEERWSHDRRVPPWALDLARHESLRIEIAAMPPGPTCKPAELSLESGLSFSEASRLVRYDYAVQRLSADESDRSEPLCEATALLVYRSPEHEVRYLELSPLAAAIVDRLMGGEALRVALEGAAAERGLALDQATLEGTARLLADLAERGALLGPRESTRAASDVPARPKSDPPANP